MPKITTMFSAANHTDPVTGQTSLIIRNAHNHQTSGVLKRFQKCVADKRRGQRATGNTPRERAINARAQQAAAAKACAGGR